MCFVKQTNLLRENESHPNRAKGRGLWLRRTGIWGDYCKGNVSNLQQETGQHTFRVTKPTHWSVTKSIIQNERHRNGTCCNEVDDKSQKHSWVFPFASIFFFSICTHRFVTTMSGLVVVLRFSLQRVRRKTKPNVRCCQLLKKKISFEWLKIIFSWTLTQL